MKTEDIITKAVNKKVSRRTFIKTAAIAGGAAAATGAINFSAVAGNGERDADSVSGAGVVYKRSGCWGCAFGCGIQVRVVDGVATKIDGNPYDTVVNDLAITTVEVEHTSEPEPVKNPGKLCPKGQAMLKELYDPYRVLTPLKRAGKRGEGKWTAISWGTAIDEIVNGGNLPDNTGVGTYAFDGLADIKGDGANDAAGIHAELTGQITVGKAQRIIWTDGRNQQGTQGRFLGSLGASRYDHSSLCNGNWKAAWKKTFGEYIHRPDVQTDQPSDYVMYIGANPFEAEQGLNYLGRRLTSLLASGATKLVILDPRLSVSASKANNYNANTLSVGSKWLRIKQGGDGAFALGMIKRWFASGTQIITTNAHLQATRATATKLNYTNAAYLVEIPTVAYPFGKISANVVDAATGNTVAGSTVDNGALDPVGSATPVAGQYDSAIYSGTVYQLLKARVESLAWADVEAATGLTQAQVEAVANEFWSAARPVAFPYRGATQNSSGYYTAHAWGIVNNLRDRLDRPGGLALQESNYGLGGTVGNNGSAPAGASYRYDRGVAAPTHNSGPTGIIRPWTYQHTNGIQQEIFASEALGYPYRAKAHLFYAHNPVYTHHAGPSDVAGVMTKIDGAGYWVPLYVNMTTTLNETCNLCDYVLPESTWAERWTTPQSPYGGPLATRGTIRRPIVGSYSAVTIEDAGGGNSRSTYWYSGPYSSIAGAGPYAGSIALANALTGPQDLESILILMGRRMRESGGALGTGDANFSNYGYDGQSAGVHYDSSYDHFSAAAKGASILGGTANEPGTTETLKQALDAVDADTSITAAAAATALDFAGKPWRKYLWMGGRRKNANASSVAGRDNLYQGGDAGPKEYIFNRTAALKKIWNDTAEGKKATYMDARYHDQLPPVSKTGSVLDIAVRVRSASGADLGAVDEAAGFNFTVTSNKLAIHTQSRTSNNEWLRELEPSNYIWVKTGSTDSNSVTLVDGDKVKLTANYSDGVGLVNTEGEIRTTNTLADNVAYTPHAFGRWASGASTFKVGVSDSTNGLTTAATADAQGNHTGGTMAASYGGQLNLASGTGTSIIGRRDDGTDVEGGFGVSDIGSGQVHYGNNVKITKI